MLISSNAHFIECSFHRMLISSNAHFIDCSFHRMLISSNPHFIELYFIECSFHRIINTVGPRDKGPIDVEKLLLYNGVPLYPNSYTLVSHRSDRYNLRKGQPISRGSLIFEVYISGSDCIFNELFYIEINIIMEN